MTKDLGECDTRRKALRAAFFGGVGRVFLNGVAIGFETRRKALRAAFLGGVGRVFLGGIAKQPLRGSGLRPKRCSTHPTKAEIMKTNLYGGGLHPWNDASR